jgi:hypothetical protein
VCPRTEKAGPYGLMMTVKRYLSFLLAPVMILQHEIHLNNYYNFKLSRYSDWLRARRPGGAGVRVPVGYNFSLLHIVQTGSGVHPTSYKMDTGGSFPEVKRQGREADHSPPTSAEVKKM